MKDKRILVLAPHTDDGELGCGATISRLIREKAELYYVAFSSCEESLQDGYAPDTLVKELLEATSVLGIPRDHVLVKSYKVRHFYEKRQEILDDLIAISRTIEPDIVFMPSRHDIHQDHLTIANEGLRAFKKNTILGYELPWNDYTFDNQAFFCVEQIDVEKKVSAIMKYKSQDSKQYVKPDNIISILRTHGTQVGVAYAEVFEVPRLLIKGNGDIK